MFANRAARMDAQHTEAIWFQLEVERVRVCSVNLDAHENRVAPVAVESIPEVARARCCAPPCLLLRSRPAHAVVHVERCVPVRVWWVGEAPLLDVDAIVELSCARQSRRLELGLVLRRRIFQPMRGECHVNLNALFLFTMMSMMDIHFSTDRFVILGSNENSQDGCLKENWMPH